MLVCLRERERDFRRIPLSENITISRKTVYRVMSEFICFFGSRTSILDGGSPAKPTQVIVHLGSAVCPFSEFAEFAENSRSRVNIHCILVSGRNDRTHLWTCRHHKRPSCEGLGGVAGGN